MSEPTTSGPIVIVGGDLDDVPEFALPFVHELGLCAMHWGRLEQHLDTTLITVNKDIFRPRKPYRDTPNTSFRRKIDTFKRWFVDDERFAAYHDRARRVVRSLKHLSADRTLLFHCNFQSFAEGPPLSAVAYNTQIVGENVQLNRCDWTIDSLRHFREGAQKLNFLLRTITTEVTTREFLETLERSGPPNQTHR